MVVGNDKQAVGDYKGDTHDCGFCEKVKEARFFPTHTPIGNLVEAVLPG